MSFLQQRVVTTGRAVFGDESMGNPQERLLRFFEEACELAIAGGLDPAKMQEIFDLELTKPVGELKQEFGGAIITLCMAADAFGLDLTCMGHSEIERVAQHKHAIRAKAAKKPDHVFLTRPIAPEEAA
jgi:hypothetical protein